MGKEAGNASDGGPEGFDAAFGGFEQVGFVLRKRRS
jgi:hypothetical protein